MLKGLFSAANRACPAEVGIQSGIMFRVARGRPRARFMGRR